LIVVLVLSASQWARRKHFIENDTSRAATRRRQRVKNKSTLPHLALQKQQATIHHMQARAIRMLFSSKSCFIVGKARQRSQMAGVMVQ